MEVAGQWRRQWAGTAEFGKVTEGGVTRQVARAMEVLHASAPGAQVRVMRAAYHSTAGPGLPASSFMLHSSRRVISSGFNLLESPSFSSNALVPSKPLEISSTPLESFPDLSTEAENYKVTEPDDTEISESSKWRVAPNGSTLRMPSEESSSTDNASIIDLDNRYPHRSVFRKYSYDSENSDILSSKKSSARASPLLDAPVTLSTLKYKSLLNNSNDWNNRRKSYSFEDTCPANETIIHSNDTLAMESSTDSGICKSTEIVNDQGDDNIYSSSFDKAPRNTNTHDETFRNWLHKNRSNTSYKGVQLKPWRQQEILIEEPTENKISLKSPGKVCITVPITLEKDDNRYSSEENDRKVKKVEFCKTELHFAAESGRVNIIATDEKPPPSNDFRKRRSAFVPITDKFEKPITLFGEKGEISNPIKSNNFSKIYSSCQITEDENENTAATKSILKNKIPKPKPYLLGENTVLGNSDEIYENAQPIESIVVSGVSLINKQLQSESKYGARKVSSYKSDDGITSKTNHERTLNKGPSATGSSYDTEKKKADQVFKSETTKINSVKNKIHSLPMSPVAKGKTRQLRESDLMYFGIENNESKHSVRDQAKYIESILTTDTNITDDIFQSVKLIRRVSNSACNSEAESEDTPEYQNITVKTNLSKPTPKPRSKYNTVTENQSERILQPIVEQYGTGSNIVQEPRQSRSRKLEEAVVPTPRSRSEPVKKQIVRELDKLTSRDYTHSNNIKINSTSPRSQKQEDCERRRPSPVKRELNKSSISEDEAPVYVNLKTKTERFKNTHSDWHYHKPELSRIRDDHTESKTNSHTSKRIVQDTNFRKSPEHKPNHLRQPSRTNNSLEKKQTSFKKANNKQRTKKLVTPEQSFCDRPTAKDNSDSRSNKTILTNDVNDKNTSVIIKPKQRSNSSHRKQTDEKMVERKQPAAIEDKEKYKSRSKRHAATVQLDISKESNKIHGQPLNGDLRTISSVEHRTNNDIQNATHRTPTRSEYVINYDDKNGTVSSICKVKPGYSQSKRKTVLKERSKDNPKEIRHRTLDKTPLLQLPEQQWNRNGLPQENRKWKIRNRVQRSCQLL